MISPLLSRLVDAPLDVVISEASAEPVLDPRTETELARAALRGELDALEALVRGSLRIAVDEAIRDRGRGERQSALVRRGVRAIVQAATDYDPDVEGPFSDFARRRVRRAIRTGDQPH